MRDADDPRTVCVTIRTDGDSRGGAVMLRATKLVEECLVPLALQTVDDAAQWFTQTFPEPGEERRDGPDRPPVTVPYGLVGPSLLLLGVRGDGPATVPAPWDPNTPTPWVPANVGPGVLLNERNGYSLPFESIRFATTGTDEEWVRASRCFELRPIGGPAWPLELVAPPRIEEPHGTGAGGSGLVIETRSGTLRCRRVEADDHALLSIAARAARDGFTMPPVTVAEVEDLLQLTAQASARARWESGAMDLDAYRRELLDLEAFEVLMDEDGDEAIALRHRIGRAPRGSTVRLSTGDGWLAPEDSLVEAAEQGWTRHRTRTLRPWAANHFRDVGWLNRPAWFVALSAEGSQSWTSVPDEHRPAALDAARASIEAAHDTVIEEEWQEREDVTEEIETAVATWRERRGQRPLGQEAVHEIITLIDPALLERAPEPTVHDGWREDVLESDREYEERWEAWVEQDLGGPAECPIALDELVDRVAPFARTSDEDDLRF